MTPAGPPLLQRLPDWPRRLGAYLEAQRGQCFAWGTSDCARFAAGAVQALTGRPVLPWAWADRASAALVLRACGGLVPAVGQVLPELAGPQWAQRGDVLLVQPAGQARRWLAVADSGRWWAPGATGMVSGPAADAVRAWGVGHG